MLRSIVMATDLSARCDRAFDRAKALARECGAKLNILHVAEAVQSVGHEAREATARKLIVEDLGGDPAEITIAYGSAPKAIARTTDAIGSDLLICGVSRWNGINDFILGTAVDHIVRYASVPVLVVKRRPHAPYRRILLATDFSDCSRAALITAAQIFPQTEIHVVHAFHVSYEGWNVAPEEHDSWQRKAQGELDTFLAHPDIDRSLRARIQPMLVYGDTRTEIGKATNEIEPDLVVLGTHGRGWVAHATIGSMASDLLASLPMDTLMVRKR